MPEPVENYVDRVLDKNGTSYKLHDTDCRTIANSKSVVKNQTETVSYGTLVVDETLVDSATSLKMTIKNTAARCIYYQGDGSTATATNAADFHDAISKAYSAGTGVKKTVGFQVRYTNTANGDSLLIPATHMFTETGSSNGVIQFVLPAVDGSSLILVVDTYTMGNASDGSADTHTITTQPIGAPSVGYIIFKGDLTTPTAASFTVRNAPATHAIVKKIYSNRSEVKNNLVILNCDYKAGVGTTDCSGAYDIEVVDSGVNKVTIAFKFSLPDDAANTLLNSIFYVTDTITIGSADDGSGDTHTFTTFKVSGTAM